MLNSYSSTKSFYNYPCAHRQWRHEGHCALVHGYSRSFHFWFQCHNLDPHGFVVDFGGLKKFKVFLDDWYDHTLLLNEDDPLLPQFRELEKQGACRIKTGKNIGMEGTANFLYQVINQLLEEQTGGRAWCFKVEVRENDKNSAVFEAYPDIERGVFPWKDCDWDLDALMKGIDPVQS